MSYSTQPAFIHYGSWNEKTRQHPCMEFMEKYTNAHDAKTSYNGTDALSKWFTDDFVLVRGTGQVDSGPKASTTAIREEIYAPFSEHLHDPTELVCWEIKDGWQMIGVATLYWNLQAPGEGEKVKDNHGKQWDGAGPAAFMFKYRKTGEGNDWGIQLSEIRIMADPTVAIVTMLKRGMMKPEQLMG